MHDERGSLVSNEKVIFHVDDSRIGLKMVSAAYKDTATIISAASIDEAVEALTPLPDISCFLIDYNLGTVNGLSLVTHIRSLEKYAQTPIVLISVSMTPGIAYRAMKAGVHESLSKGVPMPEIKAIIDAQIDAPTVKSVERTSLEISCAAWEIGDTFYQYCPDNALLVSGASAKEAREAMKVALDKAINQDNQDICGVTVLGEWSHLINITS